MPRDNDSFVARGDAQDSFVEGPRMLATSLATRNFSVAMYGVKRVSEY